MEIIENPPIANSPAWRRLLMHGCRWCIFAAILFVVHQQHQWFVAQSQGQKRQPVTLNQVQDFFPTAAELAQWRPGGGGQTVVDGAGQPVGYVLQTSPQSDSIIGYSGPTNTLIAVDTEDTIVGIAILSSGDTKDHVEAVVSDRRFMHAWNGRSRQQAREQTGVDAVSGATLTSMAIAEGITRRLGGSAHSYRFPEPLTVADAERFFPAAARIKESSEFAGLTDVLDADGRRLGAIARTSPAADTLVGYQGPTDTLTAVDAIGTVLGIAVRDSYDNDPYVGYVADDDYFLSLFNGRSLDQLAELDLFEEQVEGVSGATMTSMAVAEGLVKAADRWRQPAAKPATSRIAFSIRDFGTIAVALLALPLAFTRWRAKRWLRRGFLLAAVVYLGLINGDMVSQALLVGWTQNGVPWRLASGLVALVAIAFLCPLLTRRQVYCHHLCPHGAAQQLVGNLLPWRLRLPRWSVPILKAIPAALLLLVLLTAMLRWPLNLASVEAFDAYLFRIAGWISIAIAVVGLTASLFVPTAYCRFGCPTGAVLNFLRYNGRSDRFSRQDFFAVALLAISLALWLW